MKHKWWIILLLLALCYAVYNALKPLATTVALVATVAAVGFRYTFLWPVALIGWLLHFLWGSDTLRNLFGLGSKSDAAAATTFSPPGGPGS